MLTGSLEDKVNLSRVVFALEMMLARSVEVELPEGIPLTSNESRAADDNLDSGAEVLKDSTLGVVGDGEAKGRATDDSALAGDDIDGRLVLASGADGVASSKAVPVKRALELMVAEGAIVTGDDAIGARAQMGAVVAHGSSHGGNGEDDSGGLHVDER